jgi:magnesium transporter
MRQTRIRGLPLMLKIYHCDHNRLAAVDMNGLPAGAPGCVWFDLLNPTAAEFAFVTRETGLSLPEEADIVEIENSSRLAAEDNVLTVTMPIATRDADGLRSSSCGFVLSQERLVTIRFAESLVFDKFADTPHDTGKPEGAHSAYLFVGLLEAIVDRQADVLEGLRTELDTFSHRVFRRGKQHKKSRQLHEEMELRAMVTTLGIAYEAISFLRDSQLGVARIAPYVSTSVTWLPKPVEKRLKTLTTDINSLNEFSVHLSDKVQFLLDATLGLINIAQSTLMKVFTIVSVVGIPPTLIAGIYGMNFVNIPELHWTYGYGYAWVVMILSAVLPLAWFRYKDWI